MNCYTIEYRYGSAIGTRMIDAETEDEALDVMRSKMQTWTPLAPHQRFSAVRVIKAATYYEDEYSDNGGYNPDGYILNPNG